MNQRPLLIAGLIVGGLTLSWALSHFGGGNGVREQLWGEGADIGHSGESFPLGDLQVIADFGYSEDGDRLRYMVIRAYPPPATVEARLADARYDINSGFL